MSNDHYLGGRAKAAAADNPFLSRFRTLIGLNEEECDALASQFSDRTTIAAGSAVVTEGDEPQRVHVVIDGWAGRMKLLPSGDRHISSVLVPGDICDIDGLHVRSYDYGVMTLTPCTVASADRGALLALCDRYPKIARGLTWLCFVDNSLLNELTVSLARRSALERLAHLICELMQRLNAVGRARADGFELLLTQEKLAEALGLTAVHINRMFRQLRDDGLIELAGRSLTARDWNALKRIAGFSPGYLHLEGMR